MRFRGKPLETPAFAKQSETRTASVRALVCFACFSQSHQASPKLSRAGAEDDPHERYSGTIFSMEPELWSAM